MASSVATIVEKRLRSFAYLKDVYQGNRHFLSVASIGGSPSAGTSKEDGADEVLGACCWPCSTRPFFFLNALCLRSLF